MLYTEGQIGFYKVNSLATESKAEMSVLEKTRIPNVFTSLLLTFSGAKGSPFRLARL